MIINGEHLLIAAPIVDMVDGKRHEHGVSSGLGEAGYDIRIKQEVIFSVDPWNQKLGCFSREVEQVGNKTHYSNHSKGKGRFIIASAMEEFKMPYDLVGIVHDKSTWARRGLSVFNTVIEPGWRGFLTLELVYHGDEELIIPAGAGIAQVIFSQTIESSCYEGKYQNQEDRPVPARSSEDLSQDISFNGTKCVECDAPQFITSSGVTCVNGHGGADGY